MIVHIPGVGDLEGDAQFEVTYTGATMSTITKVGKGGVIYKYSGDVGGTYDRTFYAYARDAHLFVGPFQRRMIRSVRMDDEPPLPPQIFEDVDKVYDPDPYNLEGTDILRPPSTITTSEGNVTIIDARSDKEDKTKEKSVADIADIVTTDATTDDAKAAADDMKLLANVGSVGEQRLTDAGFSYWEDVADADPAEIAEILKFNDKKAMQTIESAKGLLGEAE